MKQPRIHLMLIILCVMEICACLSFEFPSTARLLLTNVRMGGPAGDRGSARCPSLMFATHDEHNPLILPMPLWLLCKSRYLYIHWLNQIELNGIYKNVAECFTSKPVEDIYRLRHSRRHSNSFSDGSEFMRVA